MNMSSNSRICRVKKRERGVSLLFALMALVVMGLAGIALARWIDTGMLVMGNLGFRKVTILASDAASEQAIRWLQANQGNTLDTNSTLNGYYATSLDELDPTGNKTSATNKLKLIDWDLNNCLGVNPGTYDDCLTKPATGTPVDGNTVRWVITRLCTSSGPQSGANPCAQATDVGESQTSERGSLAAGGRIGISETGPYFRILVRVSGPRGTVAYTETLAHF
jgi:type IV pilus assembly protein PilX